MFFPQQKSRGHCFIVWVGHVKGQSSTKTSLDWGFSSFLFWEVKAPIFRKRKSTTWTKLTLDLFESCFFFFFPHGLSTWIFVTAHSLKFIRPKPKPLKIGKGPQKGSRMVFQSSNHHFSRVFVGCWFWGGYPTCVFLFRNFW